MVASLLDNGALVWGDMLVLAVTLKKRRDCRRQNIEFIVPDQDQVAPSPLSRSLRSYLAHLRCKKMPPAGRFAKEKGGAIPGNSFIEGRRTTCFARNMDLADDRLEGYEKVATFPWNARRLYRGIAGAIPWNKQAS